MDEKKLKQEKKKQKKESSSQAVAAASESNFNIDSIRSQLSKKQQELLDLQIEKEELLWFESIEYLLKHTISNLLKQLIRQII